MEICIIKNTGKNQTIDRTYYPILNFEKVGSSNSMLLVSEGEMDNDGTKMKFHEIFKVQFIASCKISLTEKPILVDFYIDEMGALAPNVLSELPNNYYQDSDRFLLVDYKSYSEICGLTGETPLNFSDYLKEITEQKLGINSLLDNEGVLLNRDEQIKFYEANPASV